MEMTMLPEPNRADRNPLAYDVIAARIAQKGLQSIVNPFHSRVLKEITRTDDPRIAEYECALDTLAGMIEGMKRAIVTGGLAVPTTYLARHPKTTPRFYRQHYALHLSIARSQFPELVARTHAQGYYPFARIAMRSNKDENGNKVSKTDTYYPLPWEEIIKIAQSERLGRIFGIFSKTKNLRLVKVESGTGEMQPHKDLTDYIDVYLHHYQGGMLHSNDDKKRKCPEYFKGEVYTTITGKQLPIVNINYITLIKRERFEKNKKNKKGETDRKDLEYIARILSKIR